MKKVTLLGTSFKNRVHATQFDMECAMQLIYIIQGSKKFKRNLSRANKKQWALHFSHMILRDKIKKSRIQKALDWYECHIDDKYTPQALAASSFRRKFHKIEDSMQRNAGSRQTKEIKITAQAHYIARTCETFSWPLGCEKDLLETIQMSLNAYEDFRDDHEELHSLARRTRLRLSKQENGLLMLFCDYMTQRLEPPEHFVTIWMQHVSQMIVGWVEWEGPLTNMRFNPKSKWFQKRGTQYSWDYFGSPLLWQLHKDEMDDL